jgi:hypothetical protein
MFRTSATAAIVVSLMGLASTATLAGVPRDLVLAADEQIADDATGITIARGNAEVLVTAHHIRGTADVIEVRPNFNEILFKGRANLSVGATSYASDTVSCTLDFTSCTAVGDDQDLPPLPAAATTPR